MELTVEHHNLENCQLSIKIEIPYSELAKEYQSVKQEFSKVVQIPGFRKGKVPVHMVEARYKDSIKGRVIENVLPKAYQQSVKDHDLKVFGQPITEEVTKYKENESLKVNFKVDRMPEVKLSSTSDFEIKEDKYKAVTDTEVEEEVQRQLRSKGKMEETKGSSQEGSYVKFNARVLAEGADESLNLNEYPAELKEANPIPYSLYSDLIGLKKGEKKRVEKSFPKDHNNSKIAGKSFKFEIEITEVKKIVLPELNDELAKEMGYQNVSDVQVKARKSLENYLEAHKKNSLQKVVLDAMRKEASFEISAGLIQAQTAKYLQGMKSQFQGNEQAFNSYLAMRKQTEEDLIKELKETSRINIENELLISEIYKAQEIEITEEDMIPELEKRAENLNQEVKEVRKNIIKTGEYSQLKEQLKIEKAIYHVYNKSKIKKGKSITVTDLMTNQNN